MKLSILIPAYNEQDNIVDIINRIEHSLDMQHELVVIDDYSRDATAKLVDEVSMQYNNVRLVKNKLAKGLGNAIRTGFNNTNTDVVIPVMADLCDDLSTIKIMLDKINAGYDIVCASRYIKGGVRLGGPKLKGLFSCFAGWSLYYLLGLPTHDIANSFKMYRRKVIDTIDIESCSFEVSMEITLKAYDMGFKITEVPTVWKERTRGKSNFRIFKLFPRYFKLYIWAIFKRLIR